MLQGLDDLLAAMSDPLADAAARSSLVPEAQQQAEGLSKAVLARCTTLEVRRRLHAPAAAFSGALQ